MPFAASIHCMDGRIQEPVIAYIKRKAGVEYVDAITEAGPVAHLARGDEKKTSAVTKRLQVSVDVHGARQVFISGHHDCAGNPVDRKTQIEQVKKTIERLLPLFPQVTFHGLWIDEYFKVKSIGEL